MAPKDDQDDTICAVTLKGWRSMKWLEGWLGAVAGGGGLLVTFLTSVISSHTLDLTTEYVPYYVHGQLPVGAQWIRLLIGLPTITATLLFAGVLWGLWLDLNGQRTRGRVMLLACASIILLLPFFSTSEAALVTLMPAMLFGVLALGAGMLACVRRERQVNGAH